MKNKKQPKNFLSFIPVRNSEISYTTDENGLVILEKTNKGLFNKIAQKVFKKPKISYIHMEEMGSYIWSIIDGVRNIEIIGKYVNEHFGEKAEPLYERLCKYFQIMESYEFITFK